MNFKTLLGQSRMRVIKRVWPRWLSMIPAFSLCRRPLTRLMSTTPIATFDDFTKIDLRVGRIVEVWLLSFSSVQQSFHWLSRYRWARSQRHVSQHGNSRSTSAKRLGSKRAQPKLHSIQPKNSSVPWLWQLSISNHVKLENTWARCSWSVYLTLTTTLCLFVLTRAYQ